MGQRADVVLALGQDHARQFPLGHLVDALQQAFDRGRDPVAKRRQDAQRQQPRHPEEQREHAQRGRAHGRADVVGRAFHPQHRHRPAIGVLLGQAQARLIVKGHGHREGAAAIGALEEPPDGDVLRLGGLP